MLAEKHLPEFGQDEMLVEGQERRKLELWLKEQISKYPLLTRVEGQFAENFLETPKGSILTITQYGRERLVDGELLRRGVMGRVTMYFSGEGNKTKQRNLYVSCGFRSFGKEEGYPYWEVIQEGYIGTKLVTVQSIKEPWISGSLKLLRIGVYAGESTKDFNPDDFFIKIIGGKRIVNWQIGKQVDYAIEYEPPTLAEKQLASVTREGDEVMVKIKGTLEKEPIALNLKFPGESVLN